jgi:hypothetical protein
VTIEVYDLLGRTCGTPVDGLFAAGRHTVSVSAAGLAAGTYLYVMRTGARVMSRTLVVEK